MDCLIASQDVRLELGVDLDGSALVGLLLVDDELVVLVEQRTRAVAVSKSR